MRGIFAVLFSYLLVGSVLGFSPQPSTQEGREEFLWILVIAYCVHVASTVDKILNKLKEHYENQNTRFDSGED